MQIYSHVTNNRKKVVLLYFWITSKRYQLSCRLLVHLYLCTKIVKQCHLFVWNNPWPVTLFSCTTIDDQFNYLSVLLQRIMTEQRRPYAECCMNVTCRSNLKLHLPAWHMRKYLCTNLPKYPNNSAIWNLSISIFTSLNTEYNSFTFTWFTECFKTQTHM